MGEEVLMQSRKEVEAKNLAEAKTKVQAMFPEHRITACWLIEK
jgi:hypothetical protein